MSNNENINDLNSWNPYREFEKEITAVEMLYNFFKHHGRDISSMEPIFKDAMKIQEDQLKKAFFMGCEWVKNGL